MTPAESATRKALRRLSHTEVAALSVGLDAVAGLEAELILAYPRLKRAASIEQARRVATGCPGLGPYGEAATAVMEMVRALTKAREDTEVRLMRHRKKWEQ